MSGRSLVLLGFGGHGSVVADLVTSTGRALRGYAAPEGAASDDRGIDLPYLGGDDVVETYDPEDVELVNGIGAVGDTGARRGLFDRFAARGFRFPALVHPRAIVSRHASVADGAQIMAGCIVQMGASIGRNVIINTGASIDHDCRILDHAHVAPGAVLSGNVTVGTGAFVGAGATVIQGVTIGERAIVGAGSVVIADVPAASTVVGNPAHFRRRP